MLHQVLVVEDNPVNSEILGHLLRLNGCEVRIAEDGVAAMELLSEYEYDVIFSDIEMPRMNGIELLKSIHENWPNIPVVIVTSFDNKENIRSCWKFGAFDFLSKPIQKKQLIEVLKLSLNFGHLDVSRQNFIDLLPDHDRYAGRNEIGVVELIDQRVLGLLKEAVGIEKALNVFQIFQEQAKCAEVFIQNIKENTVLDYEVNAFFHKLKGSAADLGLTRLIQACIEFETADQLSLDQLNFLKQSFSKSLIAIEEYQSSLKKEKNNNL